MFRLSRFRLRVFKLNELGFGCRAKDYFLFGFWILDQGFGFRNQGLGFLVWGLGFRVRVQDSRLR